MHLENIVFDAPEPRLVGRYWEAVLGTEPLTDEPGGYETRLAVPDGPLLDLCFQQVDAPLTGPARLHLGLVGDAGLGSPLLRASGDEPVELSDPAGHVFAVTPGPGPLRLATMRLEVADPRAAVDFWGWLTGWQPGTDSHTLRHPSGTGVVLDLVPESGPGHVGKNRVHLDVRLAPGDDPAAVLAQVVARGGRVESPDWGELPWQVCTDPSGNEFCLLPAPRDPAAVPRDLADVLAPLTGDDR